MLRGKAALAAAGACLLLAGAAHGAAIERNLPVVPQAPPSEVAPPAAAEASSDDAPLGPAIDTIVLLGPKEALSSLPVGDVKIVGRLRLKQDEAESLLYPYLGRPVSKKLISDISAAIVQWYRDTGHPLVSVTTPPQELTRGVLQFRVVEFALGAIRIKGGNETPQDIVSQLRVRRGWTLNADKLEQDLDSLNAYPFRHVEASFAPSSTFGQTDLELAVRDFRPWSGYLGYSNSGTSSTGFSRITLGGAVGSLFTSGSLLAYRFTSSADFWFSHSDDFLDAGHAKYQSHALSYSVPLGPSESVDLAFDAIETHKPLSTFFENATRIYEASFEYTTAVSNIVNLPGRLRFSLDAGEESGSLYFASFVGSAEAKTFEARAGWSTLWDSLIGNGNLDVSVDGSLAGLSGASGSERTTLGLSPGARHGFFYTTAFARQGLDLTGGWSFDASISAQLAGAALPDTDEIGLGGPGRVRGYTSDDGAYDSAIVSRNEVRAPALSLVSASGSLADRWSPYVFFDAGYGRQRSLIDKVGYSGRFHFGTTASSLGLGADIAIGDHFTGGLDGAVALSRALATKPGEARVEANANIAF